jgi:hypothetical protein
MDSSGLRGYDDDLGLVFNIYTDGTPPIFSSGIINSCVIMNSTLISTDFKTSDITPWIEMTDSGVAYRIGGDGDVYGTGTYGTAVCGTGVTAYLYNSARPLFSVEEELDYADIHLYDRTTIPTSEAKVGDLISLNGRLEMCTTGGTPGTFWEVGKDVGDIVIQSGKKLIFDGPTVH